MLSRSTTTMSIALAGAVLFLSSCAGTPRHHPAPPHGHDVKIVTKGPPPHAPAHGYRHKHRGVVLMYSSDLDVYRVERHPGVYFYGKYFYRSTDGAWQISLSVEGPWRSVPDYRLPGKLLDHHYAKVGKKKHKHKNKHNRW